MWKRVAQAAGLLTGLALTRSGQNPGGVKIRVRRWPGRVKNPGRAQTGSEMTSASSNLNRFDRVENGSGQNRFDWVGHVTGSS